ncbi:MAG: enoyl-CoA hydratase/isomerase family protein [Gammaproteobacteria bacterium]
MATLYDLPPGIDVACEGGLRLVTLNRPQDLNASTTEMLMEGFPRLFLDLARDAEARVAILTGAGRAFSAGGDMAHFVKTLDDDAFARAVQESQRRSLHAFVDVPIPIISAVNGPALGWGVTLATLCDVVLMSDQSYLAETHVDIGLAVGDGISFSWPLFASLHRVKELVFTGDRISPQEAVAWGLANRVVPHDQLMTEARALADKIMKKPAQAIRESKKILNRFLHVAAAQHLDTMLATQTMLTMSKEHIGIAQAFLDRKRSKPS